MVNTDIESKRKQLEELNAHVKALGEEELLKVQANLATQEAEYKQIQRRQSELQAGIAEAGVKITQTQQEIQQHQDSVSQ